MSTKWDGCTDKKRNLLGVRLVIYILLFCTPFAWALWKAFFQDIVPRHKSWNYQSVNEISNNDYIPQEVPSSSSVIKCYWGVRWFVKLNGYGVTLPPKDYEQYKKVVLQKYKDQYEGFGTERDTLVAFGDDVKLDYLSSDFFEEHDIAELELLLLANEKIEDYSIVALFDAYGGKVTYFECVICNDKTSRIIELSRMNRNAQK